METIGDRLKQYIKQNFSNIKEFSMATGISQNQLSFYLNNVRIPGGEILKKFAETGLNINWLLTGEGEMLTTKTVTTQTLKCPHCGEPLQITIG